MDAFINSLFLSGNIPLVIAGVVLLYLTQKAGGEKLNLSGFLRSVIDRILGRKPVVPPKPDEPTPDVPPLQPVLPDFPAIDEILKRLRERLLQRRFEAMEQEYQREVKAVVGELVPETEKLYQEVIQKK